MKLPNLRVPKLWTIADVVGISDAAWGKLAWIATIVGFCAVATNFSMVVAYAAAIAIDAPMMANPTGNPLLGLANGVVGVGQVLVAGMLQLGTDFCLLFAAGLAKSKYRLTPTVALVLWAICAANTIEMKTDAYEAIGHERREQAATTADAAMPADVLAAKQLLAGYKGKPAPAELAVSQALIDGSTVADLEKERADKVAARAAETETGRGTRWDAFDKRIGVIDGELATARAKIAAAKIALAERQAFDAATVKATGWDTRAREGGNASGYDDDAAIALRVWGLSILSFLSILVGFAADKKSHDLKLEAAEREKRSEAGKRAAATREQNRNTFTTEWQEAAPLDSRALPDLGAVEPGAVAQAATRTPKQRGEPKHPDAAGDDPPASVTGNTRGEGDDGTDQTGSPAAD